MDNPGSEAQQEVIGGSGSGEITISKSGIQDVVFELEDFLLVTAERVRS